MSREGITGLVWYLAFTGLFTVLWRGVLGAGVKIMIRKLPNTAGFMTEVERYGWWIALVLGAVAAAAL